MASLPGIIIKIGADTKKAVDGLNRVDKALGRTTSRGTQMANAVGKLGPALAVAGAAAGAFAVKLGVDAVQAAIEDEAAVKRLATSMKNLGFSARTREAEDYISQLQKMYGVADSDMRPAFDRLLTATKDMGAAQGNLQTALNISASTGKSLTEVVDALSRGYAGNKRGILALNTGLSKATINASSMDDILAQLNKRFAGSAAAQAETMAGKLSRVSEAAAEASEAVGYALVDALDGVSEAMGGTDGAVEQIDDFGTSLAATVGVLGDATVAVAEFTNATADMVGVSEQSYGAWEQLLALGGPVGGLLARLTDARGEENAAAEEQIRLNGIVAARYAGMAAAATDAAIAVEGLNDALGQGTTMDAGYAKQIAQANELARRKKAAAAAKRRAERLAAKKAARAAAVRDARQTEANARRATARTGRRFAAMERGKYSC